MSGESRGGCSEGAAVEVFGAVAAASLDQSEGAHMHHRSSQRAADTRASLAEGALLLSRPCERLALALCGGAVLAATGDGDARQLRAGRSCVLPHASPERRGRGDLPRAEAADLVGHPASLGSKHPLLHRSWRAARLSERQQDASVERGLTEKT